MPTWIAAARRSNAFGPSGWRLIVVNPVVGTRPPGATARRTDADGESGQADRVPALRYASAPRARPARASTRAAIPSPTPAPPELEPPDGAAAASALSVLSPLVSFRIGAGCSGSGWPA